MFFALDIREALVANMGTGLSELEMAFLLIAYLAHPKCPFHISHKEKHKQIIQHEICHNIQNNYS